MVRGGRGGRATAGLPPGRLLGIMYHPVLANADDNEHEFIELHNAGAETVSLEGGKSRGRCGSPSPRAPAWRPGNTW